MIQITKVKFLFFQYKKRQLYINLYRRDSSFSPKTLQPEHFPQKPCGTAPFHFSIREVITYAAAKLMSNPIR